MGEDPTAGTGADTSGTRPAARPPSWVVPGALTLGALGVGALLVIHLLLVPGLVDRPDEVRDAPAPVDVRPAAAGAAIAPAERAIAGAEPLASAPAPREAVATESESPASPASPPPSPAAPSAVHAGARAAPAPATWSIELRFETGQRGIDSAHYAGIEEAARRYHAEGRPPLVLTCRSDCYGPARDNYRLSKRRCRLVRRALVRADVPADQVRMVPLGERASGCTPGVRSGKERRVSIRPDDGRRGPSAGGGGAGDGDTQ